MTIMLLMRTTFSKCWTTEMSSEDLAPFVPLLLIIGGIEQNPGPPKRDITIPEIHDKIICGSYHQGNLNVFSDKSAGK